MAIARRLEDIRRSRETVAVPAGMDDRTHVPSTSTPACWPRLRVLRPQDVAGTERLAEGAVARPVRRSRPAHGPYWRQRQLTRLAD